MNIKLLKKENFAPVSNKIIFVSEQDNFDKYNFTVQEKNYIKKAIKNEIDPIVINQYDCINFVLLIDPKKEKHLAAEKLRKTGNNLIKQIEHYKIKEIEIIDELAVKDYTLALIEGILLSSYTFHKYKKAQERKKTSLHELSIVSEATTAKDIEELNSLLKGVFIARDLVNEPFSFLNAEQLAQEIKKTAHTAGFSFQMLDKKKIQSLKMGGVLAVNQGSAFQPTFSILEWKPKNAVNSKPIVLVGKGIVYDTGGLSLKPTKQSMDHMKCDMAGAAAIVGTFYAIAQNNLPVHLLGLIPATDNCVNSQAYAPGDVVKMANGMSVEVLNSDAEGRMILADALHYAERYSPELVIDLATLTGAAVRAVGIKACAMSGTASEEDKNKLKQSGFKTFERLIEFPLWDDYADTLKSDIADIKNLGNANAGMIVAAKFLENFTLSPWIHLDIAGPAFYHHADSYRGKGGTGFGVRLLYDFIKAKTE